MGKVSVKMLHLMVVTSTCFCSCKKWNPDKQYENDVALKNQELLLLESHANTSKEKELSNFIEYLKSLLNKSNEFLIWAENNKIPHNITTTVVMNNEKWETREYSLKDLIDSRYGLESEISKYYRTVNSPKNLNLITNGTRIINPSIF